MYCILLSIVSFFCIWTKIQNYITMFCANANEMDFLFYVSMEWANFILKQDKAIKINTLNVKRRERQFCIKRILYTHI